jgi:hypothetical protein
VSATNPARAVAMTALWVSAASWAPATAAAAEGGGLRFSLGVLAGAVSRDASLADYQWDVTPRAAWGGQAMAGAGPFEAGVRCEQVRTTQRLGTDETNSPTVRATSVEMVGRARLGTFGGTEIAAVAAAGRLNLSYDPDRLSVDTGMGTVDVAFAPIHEWIGGGGLALRHALPGPWTIGMEVDRRVFGLNAAHREGGQVIVGRESFGEWNARLELNWLCRRR